MCLWFLVNFIAVYRRWLSGAWSYAPVFFNLAAIGLMMGKRRGVIRNEGNG